MTPRTVCMMAAFALGLLVNAALTLWLPAEIHFWKSLKPVAFEPVTFESVSSNGKHVHLVEFGHGHVYLDFVSFGPGGEIRSFHIHY